MLKTNKQLTEDVAELQRLIKFLYKELGKDYEYQDTITNPVGHTTQTNET